MASEVTPWTAQCSAHSPTKNGNTPVHLAEAKRHAKQYASVDLENEEKQTPLQLAAGNGHAHVCELLIKAGAFVERKNKSGWTPIYVAAEKGHAAVIEVFWKAKAAVNTDNYNRWSVLHCAARFGKAAVVKVLLEYKFPTSSRDMLGWTPLHIAAFEGHQEVIQILLQYNADPNSKTDFGWTPLQLALQGQHGNILYLLQPFSAKMTEESTVTLPNPIHEMTDVPINCIYSELVKAVALGYTSSVSDLTRTMYEGSTTIVVEDINHGFDLNAKNEDGDTLLHVAIRAINQAIVDFLLDQPSIDVNACNKAGFFLNNALTAWQDGITPLVLAIKLGQRRLAHRIHAHTRSVIAVDVAENDIVVDNIHFLGYGATTTVFKGVFNGKEVAVKRMIAKQQDIEILKQEISILKRYRSPYIVELIAVPNNLNESPLFALEYMDCGDLRQYLIAKREHRPTMIEVTSLEVAWVVANALADLHHKDIIHRDVKSHNILLSTKHFIKLSDFTMSRAIEQLDPEMTIGSGTLYWTAPEVFRGNYYNYKADIYSFGVLLTELDTQQMPYPNLRLTPMELMKKVSSGLLRPSLSATCEPWLRDLANKCLLYDAKLRPSIYEIVELLQSQFCLEQ